ncbi:unnamed protein product, partial [Protopolystoma xenopodis]
MNAHHFGLILQVDATTIDVCVTSPEDTGGLPVTHYELRIQKLPGTKFYGPFTYRSGNRQLKLPYLIPNTFYHLAISAVSDAGRGPNEYIS